MLFFFFFKQKTAYEMRISDWSSDVCSSDLLRQCREARPPGTARQAGDRRRRPPRRGLGGLLRGAPLWRAFGHADVQGAEGLSRRGGHPPRDGEIRPGRARAPRAHAGPPPAGRAAVNPRGLTPPLGPPGAAPRPPGPPPPPPGPREP